MRAVVQRVERASVEVEGEIVGAIGQGYLILLGVGGCDTEAQAEKLWAKVAKMRIFADEDGRTNRSLLDVGGSALIVSQFTLYANCRRGNRPSFTEAGAPDAAEALYEYFCDLARRDLNGTADADERARATVADKGAGAGASAGEDADACAANAGAGAGADSRATRSTNMAGTQASRVATGIFGAHMAVSLVNDGPFTICLDTDAL